MPALLTPLILWKLPTDFLPILLGDYLALHFLLYGALTAAATIYLMPHARISPRTTGWKSIAIAAACVAAYNIIAFGLPIDAYVFSFLPISCTHPADRRYLLRHAAVFHRR